MRRKFFGRLVAANRALRAREQELATLRNESAELAGYLVHDMKTPLAVVATNLAYLRENAPSAEAREALDDAEAACVRLGTMLGDLLLVARLEAGVHPVRRERVQLAHAAEQTVRSRTRDVQARRVAIEVRAAKDAAVVGDPELVQRLCDNLLENALRHTPSKGRIAVEAIADGPGVDLRVSNSGTAIPAEEHPRLFERRARLEGKTRAARGNIALGLYLCKLAAHAHGADIFVESSAEWPVSFVVRFPAPAKGAP